MSHVDVGPCNEFGGINLVFTNELNESSASFAVKNLLFFYGIFLGFY